MIYSAIGLLGIIILIIENQDILINHNKAFHTPAWKVYRQFLFSVLIYYVTDILWGILEENKLDRLLFTDTLIYFVAMAMGLMLWTKYIVTYLDEKNFFEKFLLYSGRVIAGAVTLLSVINIFYPVLFTVDSKCVYRPKPVRYIILTCQILLLVLISVYAFSSIIKHRNASDKAKKYRTLGLFGLIMAICLLAQLWYPYLPLYSIAYMLGTCLLRAFVIGDEKEEFRKSLEEAEKIVDAQTHQSEEYKKRLVQAQTKANIDALTGVKNKHAYLDTEDGLNNLIIDNKSPEFAIVVFDINNLKKINDIEGHHAGDQYLRNACSIICSIFKQSAVFRIGGDEFAVIAQDDDYKCIDELIEKMSEHNTAAIQNNGIVIACGMAKFENDKCVEEVFDRADLNMYDNKNELKNAADIFSKNTVK